MINVPTTVVAHNPSEVVIEQLPTPKSHPKSPNR